MTPNFVHIAAKSPRIPRSVAFEMALKQRAIGQRIAALRKQRQLTQEEVAEKVGVTTRAEQEWEAGGGIRPKHMRKLGEVLGFEPAAMLGLSADGDRLGQMERELREALELLRKLSPASEDEADEGHEPPADALGLG